MKDKQTSLKSLSSDVTEALERESGADAMCPKPPPTMIDDEEDEKCRIFSTNWLTNRQVQLDQCGFNEIGLKQWRE